MTRPSLLALSLLATLTTAAHADHDKGTLPVDAPPACVDPVGRDGLARTLAKGPTAIGTYQLVAGRPLEVKGFRLLATAHFMAARVGATTGEWLPGLEIALVDEVKRDGATYLNTVEQHGYEPLRIGTYRVAVRKVSKDKRGTIVDVAIEDLGCREDAIHAPLAPGESKTVWVSTEGTRTYTLSTGEWYENDALLQFSLSSGLAPDVQQEPGTKTPRGHIAISTHERMENTLPSWDDRYINDVKVGDVFELPAHTVTIEKLVLGGDTTLATYGVTTRGKAPVMHALITIKRRPTPLDTIIRKPGG